MGAQKTRRKQKRRINALLITAFPGFFEMSRGSAPLFAEPPAQVPRVHGPNAVSGVLRGWLQRRRAPEPRLPDGTNGANFGFPTATSLSFQGRTVRSGGGGGGRGTMRKA